MSAAFDDPHDPDSPDSHDPDQPGDEPFQSAEEWLAARGVRRDRIRIAAGGDVAPDASTPPPSVREVRQLATEAPPAVPGDGRDVPTPSSGQEPAPTPDHLDLSDEVSRALLFIQRSTASTPASTGRLRRKLADRDVPAPAARIALDQAASQGLVDDDAFAAALADEARAKGHAATRIRKDLRTREFDDQVIAATLDRFNDRDPEAVAFDVARARARTLQGLDTETAFRRLVGHLARRGHNEHVARKVARQVVFNEMDDDVISGH